MLGQVEFERIHKQYYRGSEGALLVCDLTRKDTFEHLNWWLDSLYEVVGEVPVSLLGNKLDLKDEHQVTFKDMSNAGKKLHCPYYLTSAKTGENVEKAFENIGRRVCEK